MKVALKQNLLLLLLFTTDLTRLQANYKLTKYLLNHLQVLLFLVSLWNVAHITTEPMNTWVGQPDVSDYKLVGTDSWLEPVLNSHPATQQVKFFFINAKF